MEITWEQGRIWHSNCESYPRNSGIMKAVKTYKERGLSLMKCLNCGKHGFYPHGGSGVFTTEEVLGVIFDAGDLVTRDGSDLHLVTRLDDEGFLGDFLCVKEPTTGWISLGETETNLARRYSFVRTPTPGEFEVPNKEVSEGENGK